MNSVAHLQIVLFSVSGLIVGLTSIILALILILYGKSKLHRIFALFNFAVAWWGIAAFFIGKSTDAGQTLLLFKIAHIGIIFIAVFFYHFSCIFAGINRKFLISFAYYQGIFFSLLAIFDLVPFISKVEKIKDSLFYLQSSGVYPIFFSLWIFLVFVALVETFLQFRIEKNAIKRNQELYLLFWFCVGFSGGISNFLPAFQINIIPFGNFTIPIYCGVASYAILKHSLLDIKIVVTRFGVFFLVYFFVLGIPFGLEAWGQEWLKGILGAFGSWIPMLVLLGFATIGPFIYLYLQRKAEENILQVEQGTQDSLKQASYGMNTIHHLDKLLNLIVNVVVRTLRLDSAKIFLLDRDAQSYILKASEGQQEKVLLVGDPLILELKRKQYPLVYDEIKMLTDGGDKTLLTVESQMRDLSISVIVPIVLNNSLLGFLTLGERKSKAMYTRGLLNTLSILGNQAGLAIDRCNYIDAEAKRLEAEGLKERMVSLDHMASSMAHEIDNPMHIIRSSLSFLKDFVLKDARVSVLPQEIKNDFQEAIVRSLHAGDRVSGMIKAILDYSRMGTGKLESVRIGEAWDGFLQLIQPQIREEKVIFIKEIENDLPPVLGDRVQLEEIFMNFVRNSLHAIKRNADKKITLKIFKKSNDIVRIECSDNGYGIPKEIINDIFLSSMTTKGSSEGTGLGLYRVRKIVDLFRGKVWAESEGQEKGATFIVELPVYENSKSDNDGEAV